MVVWSPLSGSVTLLLLVWGHAHLVVIDFRARIVLPNPCRVAVDAGAAFFIWRGIFKSNSPVLRLRLIALPNLAAHHRLVALNVHRKLHAIPGFLLPWKSHAFVNARNCLPG